MNLQVADKVVWITGASGGIGRALATAFATEGARVALHAGQNLSSLEDWVAEQSWREQALCHAADLRDANALEEAATATRNRWGRIDICIANAGVWPPQDALLHEMSPARLEETIAIDLLGPLFTARAFLGSLARTGAHSDGHGASLTFIGSTAGRFGERAHVDYSAAKAGLHGVVQTLKNEIVQLDPYGRVNLVEPGWTVTHMAKPALEVPGAITRVVRTMALRQLGRARDIATTCLALSSPALSRHTSGQTITVAGGMEGRLLWERDAIDEDEIRNRLGAD